MSISDMQPVGVLFDFDGVLVDSKRVHAVAWQLAYRQMFGGQIPSEYPGEHSHGFTSWQVAEYLSRMAGYCDAADQLYACKLQLLITNAGPPDLLPGAAELCSYLREVRIPCGIGSNAPTAFIESVVQEYGLPIEHIVGADQVERPKPDPGAYCECARRCGIEAQDYDRVVVFEDSLAGLQAAVAAGMKVAGVRTTLSDAQLCAAGAVASCPDLTTPLKESWFGLCKKG